jgi:hypothetical protein
LRHFCSTVHQSIFAARHSRSAMDHASSITSTALLLLSSDAFRIRFRLFMILIPDALVYTVF